MDKFTIINELAPAHFFAKPKYLNSDDNLLLFPWAKVAQRCEVLWRFGLLNRLSTFLGIRILASIQKTIDPLLSYEAAFNDNIMRKNIFWISFLSHLYSFLNASLHIFPNGLVVGKYNSKYESNIMENGSSNSLFKRSFISEQEALTVKNDILSRISHVLLGLISSTIIENELECTLLQQACSLLPAYKVPVPFLYKLQIFWLSRNLKNSFNRALESFIPNVSLLTWAFDVLKECIVCTYGIDVLSFDLFYEDSEASFTELVQTITHEHLLSISSFSIPQGLKFFLNLNPPIELLCLLLLGKLVQLEKIHTRKDFNSIAADSEKYFLLTPPQLLSFLSGIKVERSVLYNYNRKVVLKWRKNILEIARLGAIYTRNIKSCNHALSFDARSKLDLHFNIEETRNTAITSFCICPHYTMDYDNISPEYSNFVVKYFQCYGPYEPIINLSNEFLSGALLKLLLSL